MVVLGRDAPAGLAAAPAGQGRVGRGRDGASSPVATAPLPYHGLPIVDGLDAVGVEGRAGKVTREVGALEVKRDTR